MVIVVGFNIVTMKIELIKQNYKFPVYVQKYNEKNLKNIANLSIIDTIANVGPKTLELL